MTAETEQIEDDLCVLAAVLNRALEERVDRRIVNAFAEVILERLDDLDRHIEREVGTSGTQ